MSTVRDVCNYKKLINLKRLNQHALNALQVNGENTNKVSQYHSIFKSQLTQLIYSVMNYIPVLLLFFFFSRGLVPLHNACSYGHYEVTELLVKHGASVNVADLWKFTPLHEAAAKGKYEIVRLLLKVIVCY